MVTKQLLNKPSNKNLSKGTVLSPAVRITSVHCVPLNFRHTAAQHIEFAGVQMLFEYNMKGSKGLLFRWSQSGEFCKSNEGTVVCMARILQKQNKENNACLLPLGYATKVSSGTSAFEWKIFRSIRLLIIRFLLLLKEVHK